MMATTGTVTDIAIFAVDESPPFFVSASFVAVGVGVGVVDAVGTGSLGTGVDVGVVAPLIVNI